MKNTLAILRNSANEKKSKSTEIAVFLNKVKIRRAGPSPETVKLALSNRGLVRCLNSKGVQLYTVEDVDKLGPVDRFELTPRGRAKA